MPSATEAMAVDLPRQDPYVAWFISIYMLGLYILFIIGLTGDPVGLNRIDEAEEVKRRGCNKVFNSQICKPSSCLRFIDLPAGKSLLGRSSPKSLPSAAQRSYTPALTPNHPDTEVRNAVYELCCAPMFDRMSTSDRHPSNPYHVEFDVNDTINLSQLMHVSRQIRQEYRSLLAAKHHVTVKSTEAARNLHFWTGPNICAFFPVIKVEVDLAIALPTAIARNGRARYELRTTTLEAEYHKIGRSPRGDVEVRFGFRRGAEDNWAFDRESKRAIKGIIGWKLLRDYYFDFDSFLRTVDHLAIDTTRLSGKIVRAVDQPGMRVVFHEPTFWVRQDDYPGRIGHTQCYEYVKVEDESE